MTNENLLTYWENNNIPLNETNNDCLLIIQRIRSSQLSTFRDMPLEGVKWYVKARYINVTGHQTFDDLMVIIQHYNKDMKEGRVTDTYRVNMSILIIFI